MLRGRVSYPVSKSIKKLLKQKKKETQKPDQSYPYYAN